MIIEGNARSWEIVIGLEVHAQILSHTKLFSDTVIKHDAEPNDAVSFIDAAMPGTLPVLNNKCVEQAVRTALGLNAEVKLYSVFDRKNYFYPDLPQGYQISQFYHPIAVNGYLDIKEGLSAVKRITIERIHIEQDAGKSQHDQSPLESLIDLNRSGIGLMEIVTSPDISSPNEAAAYLKNLRILMRYLGVCNGDMEKGAMRCDANVSVRPKGTSVLGTRVEIKNLNSIRNVIRAIEVEAKRQVAILEGENRHILQETRLFDTDANITRTMRAKEEAMDYRYFPEPNLLPLKITKKYIEEIFTTLPELPQKKYKRYTEELGLNHKDANVIIASAKVAVYFEELIAEGIDAKIAVNWLVVELFAYLKHRNIDIEQSPISPTLFSKLLSLIQNNEISGKIAKQVFEEMCNSGMDPGTIIKEKGIAQVNDFNIIETTVEMVMKNNPKEVISYRQGKKKLLAFFVGQVMKETRGQANPTIVNKVLEAKLKETDGIE